MTYDSSEQDTLLRAFSALLRQVTRDGGTKRQAGLKPPWYVDESHEAAIFSHLSKWKHGELEDPDSGAHPLVHLAWRALAIAWQESHGQVPPYEFDADSISVSWGLPEGLPHLALGMDEEEVDDQPDQEPERKEPYWTSPVTDKLPDKIREWLMRVRVIS